MSEPTNVGATGHSGAMEAAATRDAIRAVAAAMRPTLAEGIRRRTGRTPEEVLLDAFEHDLPGTQADVWWRASGRSLTIALDHVTGCGEEQASFMLGAAVHATLAAGGSIV